MIPSRPILNSPCTDISSKIGNGSMDCFSYFNPEKAQSASEVCELYQQALKDRVFDAANAPVNGCCSKQTRPQEAYETDTDCMSTLSDLDSISAMSDVGSYISDADSIAIRRQQITNRCSTSNPRPLMINMESLEYDDVISTSMEDDEGDMESVSASVDTEYSFDLEYLYSFREAPQATKTTETDMQGLAKFLQTTKL